MHRETLELEEGGDRREESFDTDKHEYLAGVLSDQGK